MSEFLSTWLTDTQAFFANLETLGGEFDHIEIDIQPPLGPRKLNQFSKSLPRPLPEAIRDVLATNTSKVVLSYLWEPAADLVPTVNELFGQKDIFCNGTFFDAGSIPGWVADCQEFAETSWLSDEEFRSDQELWLNSFPFFGMAGGDYLAIGDDARSVTYLSHDGESHVIAMSSPSHSMRFWRIGNRSRTLDLIPGS